MLPVCIHSPTSNVEKRKSNTNTTSIQCPRGAQTEDTCIAAVCQTSLSSPASSENTKLQRKRWKKCVVQNVTAFTSLPPSDLSYTSY